MQAWLAMEPDGTKQAASLPNSSAHLPEVDGRSGVPKNIVTEFGIHHYCPHLFRRLRMVSSEVDDLVHVPMMIPVFIRPKFPL